MKAVAVDEPLCGAGGMCQWQPALQHNLLWSLQDTCKWWLGAYSRQHLNSVSLGVLGPSGKTTQSPFVLMWGAAVNTFQPCFRHVITSQFQHSIQKLCRMYICYNAAQLLLMSALLELSSSLPSSTLQ